MSTDGPSPLRDVELKGHVICRVGAIVPMSAPNPRTPADPAILRNVRLERWRVFLYALYVLYTLCAQGAENFFFMTPLSQTIRTTASTQHCPSSIVALHTASYCGVHVTMPTVLITLQC